MRKKLIGILGAAGLSLAVVLSVYATQAGSEGDPLVSKSYVDAKITEVLNVLNGSKGNEAVSGEISEEEKAKLKAEILAELSKNGTGTQVPVMTETESYVPVYAEVGQIVLGGEGTEMILRSGKANVYITGVAGIVNATTGKELVNGNKATVNNIMIIPRADGRGVKVTEAAWLLVKGDYEIK